MVLKKIELTKSVAIERALAYQEDVTVEEMENLILEVKEFNKEKGDPKMNVLWLSNMIIRRLRGDRDYYINAEGEKGSGKSNLMLLLALLQSRYAGLWRRKENGKIYKFLPTYIEPDKDVWEQLTVDFSFERNMSFLDNTKEVRDKYNGLSRFSALVMDEGSKNLHKYNWQSKIQFSLIQMSDTERYQNKSFFVCFPNFKELNAVFRNDRIKMRLYVYSRHTKEKYASCIISVRDLSRWVTDPWHMEDNAKLFERLLSKTPSALRTFKHILYAEKKLKGYAGVFDFPSLKDISPRIWKTYMNYKLKNAKKEGQNTEEDSLNRNTLRWKITTRSLIEYIKTIEPKITNVQLGKIMRMSPSTVGTLLRERLKNDLIGLDIMQRMNSLNIEETRTKYLSTSIVPKTDGPVKPTVTKPTPELFPKKTNYTNPQYGT